MNSLELDVKKRAMASYSLGLTTTRSTLFFFAGMVPGIILSRIFPALWQGQRGLGLAFLMYIAVPLAVMILVAKGFRRRQLSWLEALEAELPLDRTSYLDVLNGRVGSGRLAVILEVGPGAAPALDALPGATIETVDGTLRIVSPMLSMGALSMIGGHPIHNGKVHRWFRRCVDDVIRPLAASRKVRSIRTELIPATR